MAINYKSYKVLYIDDEPKNLYAFESNFENEFNITVATSAEEGLKIIRDSPSIAVVIADQRLGEGKMTGIELCEMVKNNYPAITRIILTAYEEFQVAMDGINKGNIFRYIVKPWDVKRMRQDIIEAIELHELYNNKFFK